MMKRAAMWVAAAGFAVLIWAAPARAQVSSDGIYGRYGTYFETLRREGRNRAKWIRDAHRAASQGRREVQRELADARREFRREFDRSRLRALRDYQRDVHRAARDYARNLREARRDGR